MKKLSLTFYPNTGKKSKKEGKIPIYMRLLSDRKMEVRLDTFFDLLPGEIHNWNEFNQRMNSKDSELNDYLNTVSARFSKIKRDMLYSGTIPSLEAIRDEILLKSNLKTESTVFHYCRKFLLEDVENDPSKLEGTKRNYRNAISQFCQYLDHSGKKNIRFQDFDFKMADGFKKYLESTIPAIPGKKLNQTVSSSTKIKNIKPIFAKAENEGLISKSPFKKIKLNFKSKKALRLTINEVKQIYDLDLEQNPSLNFAKDLFLFMCFTGLSLTDAMRIEINSLQFENDGRILFDTSRKKTGVFVKQILVKHAQIIIEKYIRQGYHKGSGYIFPTETGESLNPKFKLIAALANLSVNISSKTGRHTCNNLFFSAKLQDNLLISCFMGWSRAKSIRDIYSDIGYEALLQFSITYEEYLSNYFLINCN